MSLGVAALALAAIFAILQSISSVDDKGKESALREQLFDLKFFLFNQPRQLSPIMVSNLSGEEKPFVEHMQGWRVVNFGYMFCPDICPMNLSLLSEVKAQWDNKVQAGDYKQPLNVIHVTFDPKRDTPKLLNDYLTYMNPDFYGLTGEESHIRQLTQQMNVVFIYEQPDAEGHYFITHSDSMALINPKGEYVGMFKGPYQIDAMIEALNLLMSTDNT